MYRIITIFIFLIFFFSHLSYAQEKDKKNRFLTSKFQIGVGMFIPTQKVNFSIDGASENNEINFGESFSFNNNSVTPNLFFKWRFAKFWSLEAEYFNASYAKKAVLEEDIEAGDYTFEEGSNVELGYKLNLYRIIFGRVIYSNPKIELGGSLGAHVINVGPYIEGNIMVNEDDNTFQTSAISATAPLPNIGLWFFYAPSERWTITAKVDWFALTVDEYSGSLWDIGPSVHYQIIKNLGVHLTYRYFNIKANVNKEYWNGSADLSFSGPTLSLIAHF